MQKNNIILPPKTIGIIGGGQLGRMMAIAAKYMGYQVAVLDPTPNCPTAQVADQQITAAYDDMQAIKQLTELSDVITYEFENVDLEAAAYIEEKGKLPQGAFALEVTQNREKEKQNMRDAGLPVPDFFIVKNGEECSQALESLTYPAVIKTCRGGYDGKGQIKLTSEADNKEAIAFADQHQHCIIEQWVSFDKEISVVFTRAQNGKIEFFPIGENDHKHHILYQTTVPATISDRVKQQAVDATIKLAEKMNIVGTFAIEMFVDGDAIYLNEMAPRPHNSGHYTIEACNISQFGQHIRAICGLPLTKIELLQPAIMVNILGEDMEHALKHMAESESGFIHLYGKDAIKEKRKMGHLTFIAETLEQVKQLVRSYEEEQA
ncbi:5-(carboxyamino)imidazole ribonucleotide synthase [Virgibacillus phasianinus]|uniref:N5-carboxyaminoimidazole ribonucleotide synthase n=1 Tax=Virgibacillus phasianinus TaxID=2017483 RepID=A0A220TYW2_9BACI|nr:5-(carboxyamino)imidazole ribonucleotide synthase [Virgibacillus phasianinus]ASK61184.1 5-(carboxyamino)imidazole ribonucleotide synthase [Virgibacillus phasianinus]